MGKGYMALVTGIRLLQYWAVRWRMHRRKSVEIEQHTGLPGNPERLGCNRKGQSAARCIDIRARFAEYASVSACASCSNAARSGRLLRCFRNSEEIIDPQCMTSSLSGKRSAVISSHAAEAFVRSASAHGVSMTFVSASMPSDHASAA